MPETFDSSRVDDLEVRLTFIDDAVSGLADADAMLAQQVRKLEEAVRDMRAELAALRAAMGHDSHSEPPPPHY